MGAKPYYTILSMIQMMHEPYRSGCQRLYVQNFERFKEARGSTHNHQAWPGGYHDHIEDAMNYAVLFYEADASTGRPMPFQLSDALVAVFLHDIEKPWRFKRLPDGSWENNPALATKESRQQFRETKMTEYGIELSRTLANAVQYAEGEDGDYRSDRRVSNELAGFVHICDHYSARTRHNYPRGDDPWCPR